MGVLSFAVMLLISCEPDEIATTSFPTNEGVRSNDTRTTKTKQLEFIFDKAGRKDGAHSVGYNPATGSKFEALLRGGDIYGFLVKKRDGQIIKLAQKIKHPPAAIPPPPPIGCPDGFDWRCVCYTHPVYDVTVCVSFCVANTIVLVTTGSGY